MAKKQAISLREMVNPTERQQQFLEAVKENLFILYGGAAGGGKSYILRWSLIGLLMKWGLQGHKGVRVGLFCEDYPALRDRHLSKIKYEFPSWMGKLRENVHEYELDARFGGGVIAFRNLDDPSKYLSVEFAAIAVDELTKNPIATFNFLRMRLRWPGIARCPFMGASNPGGVGHMWVKRLWMERDYPPELVKMAHEFAYVPAKATDNPHLAQEYVESLASLPEELRRAYLDGDWDIFAGQMFAQWRREKHVISAMPAGWETWRKFMSLDWGRASPGCALWFTVSPDARIYVYREFYFNGGYTIDMDAYDTAKVILSKEAPGERVNGRFGDPSMWAKTGTKTMHGESMADDFSAAGCALIAGDNDRKQGVNRVHANLKDAPDGIPWLQVLDTCKHLIRTLPALPRDETNIEDVDTDAEDHAFDSLKYGLLSRPAPGDGNAFMGGDFAKRRPRDEEDDDERDPDAPTFYGR